MTYFKVCTPKEEKRSEEMKTYKITQTTETFTPTASGKSWRSKPDTVEVEEITINILTKKT